MSAPSFSLGDLFHIEYGAALKADARDGAGDWEVYGSSGPVGYHSKALIEDSIIVVGRKGSVGRLTFSQKGGWPIDTTFYMIPRDKNEVDLRYAFHMLSRIHLDHLTITTSIPGLNRNDLASVRIPIPGIDEQRRIAAILDKADAIRGKRQRALAASESLEHSLFLQSVGPKAEGYQGWALATFEELAKSGKGSMRTGPFGSDLRHSEFVDEGIAVLGIDNAVKNRFAWGERRFITPEKYEKLKRYRVFPGDVIVTIMGTTGRSAVVPDDIPLAITTKHLATISPDRSKVEAEFLSNALHRHPAVLAQIAKANKGAIMDGLNLGIIKSLQIPLPPINVQRRYVIDLRNLRAMQAKMREQLVEADTLFASLSQRAFRGEL